MQVLYLGSVTSFLKRETSFFLSLLSELRNLVVLLFTDVSTEPTLGQVSQDVDEEIEVALLLSVVVANLCTIIR